MRLKFLPIHIFRETPQVLFFDAGVEGANGSDVVIHHDNEFHLLTMESMSSITCINIKLTTI